MCIRSTTGRDWSNVELKLFYFVFYLFVAVQLLTYQQCMAVNKEGGLLTQVQTHAMETLGTINLAACIIEGGLLTQVQTHAMETGCIIEC